MSWTVESLHDLQSGGIPEHVTLCRVAERHLSRLIIHSHDTRFREFLKPLAEGRDLFRDEQARESESHFMGSVKFVVRGRQFSKRDGHRPQRWRFHRRKRARH